MTASAYDKALAKLSAKLVAPTQKESKSAKSPKKRATPPAVDSSDGDAD